MRRRLSKKLSLLSNDSRGSYQAVTTIDETAPVDATQNEGPRKSRKWLSERRQKDDIEGWRGSIKVVLDSMVFQSFVALSILTNGVVIGFETDMPDLAIWNSVETVFLVIFTGELTLRLTVFGICSIFDMADSDFYWNVFDFAIVAMGIVDFLCTTFANLEAGSGATAFRLIRLLRILRIFKIVRFLKQLYLLAYGFVEAGKAVFWVTVLMLFALYICSVVLVRTFGGRQHESEAVQRLADTDFHSIPAAMLTLFQMMSEPDLTHFRPMFDEFPWFCPFLVIFTIFGSFGMIALLTGVISESMFEKNQLRVEEERQHREQLHSLLTERCLALFNEIDGDELNDNGEVPMEVFEDLLPEIAALFESHLVAFANHDLQELLDLMDLHGSGFIQKDAFCKGILSMAEGVRPMSIMQVMCAVLRTSAQVNECKEAIQKLSQRLPDCTASVSEVRHDEGSMQPRRQKNEAREAASCAESIRLERQQQQEQQQEQQQQQQQQQQHQPPIALQQQTFLASQGSSSASTLDTLLQDLQESRSSVGPLSAVEDDVLMQDRGRTALLRPATDRSAGTQGDQLPETRPERQFQTTSTAFQCSSSASLASFQRPATDRSAGALWDPLPETRPERQSQTKSTAFQCSSSTSLASFQRPATDRSAGAQGDQLPETRPERQSQTKSATAFQHSSSTSLASFQETPYPNACRTSSLEMPGRARQGSSSSDLERVARRAFTSDDVHTTRPWHKDPDVAHGQFSMGLVALEMYREEEVAGGLARVFRPGAQRPLLQEEESLIDASAKKLGRPPALGQLDLEQQDEAVLPPRGTRDTPTPLATEPTGGQSPLARLHLLDKRLGSLALTQSCDRLVVDLG